MAQLKEGSIIKKSTGNEIIATETQLNNHNTDVAAHNDIRQQINTLDADIVAHETDEVKHITSAERTKWNNKAEISDIPTKVSQLENDAEYVTQIDFEEYKSVNDQAVSDLGTRLSTVESEKADKTYVDTELLKKADKENTYTKAETDSRIQAIIGAAPEALDTLDEIAEALNNDPDFAATITNMLAQKVDKVAGMGLSEANFTNEEKTKLSNIEEGANKYIHPSTHPASMITESSTRRFVSDDEKNTWNTVADKADKSYVDAELNKKAEKTDIPTKLSELTKDINFDERYYTETEIDTKLAGKVDKVSGKGLSTNDFTNVYKNKLDGIEEGANKYIHPDTHLASMIVETSSKRFVSDEEKNKWNNGIVPNIGNFYDQEALITYILTNQLASGLYRTGLGDVSDCLLVLRDWNTHYKATIYAPDKVVYAKVSKTGVVEDFTEILNEDLINIYEFDAHNNDSTRHITSDERNKWNNKANKSDIPTKVSQLENDENYVTQEELEDAGYGDMTKGVYDTNNNGKVDIAEVAETVIGNEIQLGSRFKIVYNDIEDSLDFEVI